jgi:hypothetical protein
MRASAPFSSAAASIAGRSTWRIDGRALRSIPRGAAAAPRHQKERESTNPQEIKVKAPLLFLAAAFASPANAAALTSKNCQTNLVVFGVSRRGAAVCDPDWLNRPSAKTILKMAQPCQDRSDAEALKREGMEKFERDLKANGRDEACQALDGLLRKMD